MSNSLQAYIDDGHVVISFPEEDIPSEEREDFIAFLKTEWIARRSRLTDTEATALADEIDSSWWDQNRERILRKIEEK